ncbi:formimidoylglutamase [Flavobacterium caeni]|uniref:Arginase family enzyme n=1 Tax=Flavobacterium caeni TaxID=490189 RepID=A0A1G5I2B6_9FLAO|nr:formimidoylglutamase [Flavobacterium caeni]SCY70167.1 Arginase family enzyme [Flavobacterium caeni]
MGLDFLAPLDAEMMKFIENLTSQHLGSKVVFHTESDFPDLNQVKIAIIGAMEHRGRHAQEVELAHIRRAFYSLFPGNWHVSIADLGNILPGDSLDDSYFALQRAVAELLKRNIIPVVIGGSQDLTYALYRAYDGLEQMVNLVAVDSRFDFGKESEPISANSYLTKVVVDEPNNLFNYCNIGFQTYYNSQEEIDLIDKLFFDAYRLGDVSNNIAIAEPVFRDADLVSIDLTSVQSSSSGNFTTFMPNGFNGKEICALSRYAGISDKVSVLGIFNQDNAKQEATLVAQIMWYFIEGFHYRSNEYPYGSKEQYLKYIIPSESEELVFYKSNKTDRWWIEIPFVVTGNNKLKKSTLLPCSYEEYLAACNQEVPERWWKAQRKNIL